MHIMVQICMQTSIHGTQVLNTWLWLMHARCANALRARSPDATTFLNRLA